jgi:YYY domain-containing protein
MDWILITLKWYLTLFVIGVIFTPLTKKIFKSFKFDLGYPFAKTIGIILLSYFVFVLGIMKVLPFSRLSLIFALCLFAIINWFIYKKNKKTNMDVINHAPTIIFEELLFVFCLFFWTFIRSQEPSIHGLEKFMDFGFINSILRTKFFPPKDIWYSPEPINYYYFGHLSGAILIKLSNIKASIGYNLILATIFAQGMTQVFSLIINIIKKYDQKLNGFKATVYGLIGAYLVNLGGNLHTLYLFTKGYPNEAPIPFWKILSGFNPTTYWYPNATRFIPFTIHEFPSYSYVVADLHGHVFDIPFVLLTISLLFILFTSHKKILNSKFLILNSIALGFMAAIHYMTNAFDGPIYILLTLLIFLFLYKFSAKFFVNSAVLVVSFIFFSLPFSWFFKPFVSGIGVNCSPKFLADIGKIGPFIFEAGNCQISPFWMLFVLWGFFWISFLMFLFIKKRFSNNETMKQLNNFLLILFSFGLFLTIIPEFFYIKDIYPAHFRANTMFKLGYQAFSMMGIVSIVTFYLLKNVKKTIIYYLLTIIFIFFSFSRQYILLLCSFLLWTA